MKSRKFVFFIFIALLSVSALAFAGTGPKLYKWVDKDGITHYGSTIPPEYASQQTEQIDAQGNVVKVQAAEKTPEQLAAEQKAQQQATQQAQVDAAQQAHDKVLLDTYTSTAGMNRDRDSKLSSIDAQVNVFIGTITGLQTTLADLQDRSNELASKNQPVTPKLQKQIDDTKAQLITNQQQLLKEQQNKQEVSAQFTNDIARFKQLTAAPPAATH